MDDNVLLNPAVFAVDDDVFTAHLGARGTFADDRPRLFLNVGKELLLTATQHNTQPPHSRQFYISLIPNIESGTHQIPGPTVKAFVYQERHREAPPGKEWMAFSAASGQLTLTWDRKRKRFKATCAFIASNLEKLSFSGTAAIDVFYSQ
ncbi:hypothetical protein [Pseudomonas purpurea]|uniref:hypothetical protein n=1 Tax=Pseudomonas purpurea TaxID=3136737 RepID=UPI0032676C4E